MKTSRILPVLVFCLVFGVAASASAVTADFAGFCTLDYPSSTTAYCSFHAQYDTAEADPSSCPGSWISTIEWDLGDGYWVNDDVFIQTSYPDSLNLGAVTVRVRVTCGDNSSAIGARYVVFVSLGCYRCINMNNGWD
jgi:hypothetical protein